MNNERIYIALIIILVCYWGASERENTQGWLVGVYICVCVWAIVRIEEKRWRESSIYIVVVFGLAHSISKISKFSLSLDFRYIEFVSVYSNKQNIKKKESSRARKCSKLINSAFFSLSLEYIETFRTSFEMKKPKKQSIADHQQQHH